jgi:MFS family permease
MGMLGFSAGQQALVGSCWGIASVVGIFFSNQFADRNFGRTLSGGQPCDRRPLCLIGAAFDQFLPFFALSGLQPGLRPHPVGDQHDRLCR